MKAAVFFTILFYLFQPIRNCIAEDTQLKAQPTYEDQLQDILDIEGPLHIQDPVNYQFLLLILLAIAAVLLLGFFLLKKRDKKTIASIPPHERALADLKDARKLIESEQSLIYADRISQILRNYLEKRFIIRSTRKTTSEFLESISPGSGELRQYQNELSECFHHCDLAKYAKKTSSREVMENMEKSVFSFIEKTKEAKE